MRSCGNCKWAKRVEEMSREEKRLFIIDLYARGVPEDSWDDYVLCTKNEFVRAMNVDEVCEEWEENVPDVDDVGDKVRWIR